MDWSAQDWSLIHVQMDHLLSRAHAHVTLPELDVKGKINGSAVLDIQTHRRYVVDKAAAGSTGHRPE